MAIGTRMGRLALRNWVRPDRDFKPGLTLLEMPTFNYTEAGGLILPRGHRGGLITSTDTDGDHDINIAVGQCRDSTDAKNILLETTITKRLDATWGEGDDAGGLNATDFASGSSGIEADTTYHVFLIKDTGAITAITDAGGGDITCAASSHLLTTNSRVTISGTKNYDGDYDVTAVSAGTSFDVTKAFVAEPSTQTGTYESVDAGFDKSATATNLLSDSGYTYYRRVGSIVTNSTAAPNANILDYTQIGNAFVPKALGTAVGPTVVAANRVTVTLLDCPTGIRVLASINAYFNDSQANFYYISSMDSNDEDPSESAAPLASIDRHGSSGRSMGNIEVITNTSAQIGIRSDNDTTTSIVCLVSWYDFLGDND